MTNLDWSKGYEPDPARFQKDPESRAHFGWHIANQKAAQRQRELAVAPVPQKAPPKKRKAQSLARQLRRIKRRQERVGTKTKLAETHKTPKKGERPGKVGQITVLKAKAKAARAAFEDYKKSPDYAEKLACEKAEIAVKTKSHLQAWAEKQPGLREKREKLLQRWKSKLLGYRIRE